MGDERLREDDWRLPFQEVAGEAFDGSFVAPWGAIVATHSAPAGAPWEVSSQDGGAPGANGPSDEERVLLAHETLTGAKWLLMLACQALDGSQTLRFEEVETRLAHETVTTLCELLKGSRFPRGPKSQ
jgi:hypothetical protein